MHSFPSRLSALTIYFPWSSKLSYLIHFVSVQFASSSGSRSFTFLLAHLSGICFSVLPSSLIPPLSPLFQFLTILASRQRYAAVSEIHSSAIQPFGRWPSSLVRFVLISPLRQLESPTFVIPSCIQILTVTLRLVSLSLQTFVVELIIGTPHDFWLLESSIPFRDVSVRFSQL